MLQVKELREIILNSFTNSRMRPKPKAPLSTLTVHTRSAPAVCVSVSGERGLVGGGRPTQPFLGGLGKRVEKGNEVPKTRIKMISVPGKMRQLAVKCRIHYRKGLRASPHCRSWRPGELRLRLPTTGLLAGPGIDRQDAALRPECGASRLLS